MTMMKAIKFLLLASMVGVIAGCKLAVVVVEGGEVQSSSSGTCLEGTICVHQVNDTDYTEIFIAVPNSGWAFERWNSGDGFFCQGSANPICVISGEGTEEKFPGAFEAIEAFVASDKTFYIMPVFVLSQPFTDTAKVVVLLGVALTASSLLGVLVLFVVVEVLEDFRLILRNFLETLVPDVLLRFQFL